MYRIYRKPKALLAVIFTALLLTSYGSIYAIPSSSSHSTPPTSTHTPTQASSGFCNGFNNEGSKILNSLNSLTNKVNSNWTNTVNNFIAKVTSNDQKISQNQQTADQNRQDQFNKLLNLAKTTAQKTAVNTYITTVNTAVTTLRTAIANARNTFRSGVLSIINTHINTLTSQVTTFKQEIQTNIADVVSQCTSNPTNSKTIHANFIASMQADRTSFVSERNADKTLGSQIQTLSSNRNSAISAAVAVFKTTLQQANQVVITALK